MSRRLHITNGDIAGEMLSRIFPDDAILPWLDCLHDGPLPALPLRQFSLARAQFIASAGWATPEDVLQAFNARDDLLESAAAFPEVILWFEHDLYDQLQLIQLLAWFEEHPHPALRLVQANDYLGLMPLELLASLFDERQPVSASLLRSATEAWQALTSGDPSQLEARFGEWPTLIRLAEEYPWITDGLSRTQRAIRDLRSQGLETPEDLFRAFCALEEPRWMGDWSFFRILSGACDRAASPWCWNPETKSFIPGPPAPLQLEP